MARGVLRSFLIILVVGGVCGYALALESGQKIDGFVNINTATLQELMMLPDMSLEMADNIVLYRQANGPFSSVDELINVQGMWYTYIDEIRPYIRTEGKSCLKVQGKE
ncbi:MAG: ComEA family DNA-binding protein [Desulfomonilia bacterium]